ncbi:hypothetical protein ACS5PN_03830 [Roseateles sp. NT4]|uniref:hypothetical protein n=1 Tax=Roseateles sp. NT4 TaxID=3453715 RepID=UPI003EEF2D72
MTTATTKYTFTIGAGQNWRQQVVGRFWRILACSGPVRVQNETDNLDQCIVGDGKEKTPFGFLSVTDQSGASNTVTLVISDEAFLNAPVTNTVITATKNPQVSSLSHSAPGVATSSGQLIAANAARQYLMVQNQHPTATIWLRNGVTAAVGTVPCIKVGPGGFWEWDAIGVTNAWQVIGDAANALVTVVEG